MPNENIMQQRQQQQVMEVTQVREHLTELQRWKEAPGMLVRQQRKEYAERIVEQEKVHNERFLYMVQQRMQPVNAAGVADNAQPLQQQQPAQETYKERKKRERRAKQANKKCPGADHISMDISERVQAGLQWHNNSMEEYNAYKRGDQAGVDTRVLRNFTYGYRKDKHGNPLTEVDARRKEADRIYIDDYLSCDVERRRKHLDRMTRQLIQYSEMFSDKDHFTLGYIRDHATQAFDYGNHLTYFENVMKDPVNAAYFNDLSKEQKERLRIVQHNGQMISTFFSTIAGTKGIDMNSGQFLQEIPQMYQMQLEFITPELEKTIEKRKQMQKAFEEKQADNMVNAARGRLMDQGTKMRQKAEKMVEDDYQGLKLTTFVTGYSFDELAKYRKMIEGNFEKYQQNQQIVDKLYQGLHHGIDSMGDLTCTVMACQEIVDTISENNLTMEQKRIRTIVDRKMDAETEKIDLMRDHLTAHTDALQYLLRNKALSDPAARLLRNLGHNI